MYRICFNDGSSIHSEIYRDALLNKLNSDNQFIYLINAKTSKEEILNKNEIKYIRLSNKTKEDLNNG